jgi:hypothetical protein
MMQRGACCARRTTVTGFPLRDMRTPLFNRINA